MDVNERRHLGLGDNRSASRQNNGIRASQGARLKKSKETEDGRRVDDVRSLNDREGFDVGDSQLGRSAPQQSWLTEVWGKWPGDESIEELLAALKGC